MAQNEEFPSLSRSKERALEALLREPTLALAATAARVSVRSLYRWLQEDDVFKAGYRKARREIVNSAVSQAQKATNVAVSVTIGLMSDPETPATVRLAAARTILETALEAVRIEDIEEHLAQLEERLEKSDEYRSKTSKNGAHHTMSTR